MDNYSLDIQTDRQLTKKDIWERRLLDFSLRNTMLNLSLRRRAVRFVDVDVEKVEDCLQDGDEFSIWHNPDKDEVAPVQDEDVQSDLSVVTDIEAADDGGAEQLNRIEQNMFMLRLCTNLGLTDTKNVLKGIYRAARTAIEETGANSLYLAIGTMRWYENDKSETPRLAPVLMMPVEMVNKRGHYVIRKRDEDMVLNITLMEFLRQNYGVEVKSLEKLPADEHGVNVRKVFDILREAISSQPRWSIEARCILGIFSFSKFVMWNDIHRNYETMHEHPIIDSLMQGHLTFQPDELQTDLKALDRDVEPEDMALPVPVDSSQMTAVYEAGRGNSFILYGPPGTGKSQTITNLIANALFQGKRVLFVAQKMAALEVVQKRLEKIGLGPFCLELHSNKVTKKHVLEQLNEALNLVKHIKKPEDYFETSDQLFHQRLELLKYLDALHEQGDDGLSLYDCIMQYESFEGEPMTDSRLASIAKADFKTLLEYDYKLSDPLRTMLSLVGQPSAHPLCDLQLKREALVQQDVFARCLDNAQRSLDTYSQQPSAEHAFALDSALRDARAFVNGGMDKIINTDCVNDILTYTNLNTERETARLVLSPCREEFVQQDPVALSMEWHEIQGKWFLPRWLDKRKYLSRMRFFVPNVTKENVLSSLEKLEDFHKKEKAQNDYEPRFKKALAELVDVDVAREKFKRWSENSGRARDWYQWCLFRAELEKMGLDYVVELIETQSCDAVTLHQRFMKGLYRVKCEQKICASDTLIAFEGVVFDEKVRHYKEYASKFQTLCQKELYARLADNIPRVTKSIDNSSEIGLLNRNISNGGRGMSIRDLFDQLPELLPRLCPCMLMSPMSVAQYLSMDKKPFDLVIFDEASQMPTSEAVGAIARGKSLVVVGDPRQMPPTSFFSATNVDEDEAYIDDLESILEDCRSLGIPSLQLQWHYRSRHESLIAFSNNEYYDGSLITFPSADDRQTKVKYVFVEGTYERGGRRSNRAEAQAIVDEIVRRLRDPELRQLSIGVVAFSVAQQNLVEDVLGEALEADHTLAEWAEALYEPIFIKNLENVQGDERDVILFSIGYGPDKDGKVSMNFGPLNNAGGERRLNVAVSRARREMMVFSTMHAAQLDLRRTRARGVVGLKHFLEYAEFQTLPVEAKGEKAGTEVVRATIIAQQIAAALRERGYEVQLNVGRSQFRVDVAVASPDDNGRYCLAILLDGENYLNTQTTRDREIVQPDALHGLAWNVMRVWSADWYNNPVRVINRIEKAIRQPAPEPVREQKVVFDISKEKMQAAPKTTKIRRNERTIDQMSWIEIRQALLDVVNEQLSIPEEKAIPLASRRLGFARCGQRVEYYLQKAMRFLIANNMIGQKDGRLTRIDE